MGMSASSSSSASGRSGQSRMVMSEINVTPLVDVMLVLLIVFMVTAPMLQEGLDVELPKVKAKGISTKEEALILSLHKDHRLALDGVVLSESQLREKLRSIVRSRAHRQVLIEADRNIPYGEVAEWMGEIRAAGIYSIGLMTQPKADGGDAASN